MYFTIPGVKKIVRYIEDFVTQKFVMKGINNTSYFSIQILLKSAKKKSVFKSNLPVPARIRHASGFTLVPRTALGMLATKLSMRRKARQICM